MNRKILFAGAFVTTIFLGFSIYILQYFEFPLTNTTAGTFGDAFGVLNCLFSGLGFVAVLVTLWQQQRQIDTQAAELIEEKQKERSKFNLDTSLEAYQQACSLLENFNNDRETWIRAARLVLHGKKLAEGVTIDEHRRVLEYRRLEYRAFFSKLLATHGGAFFYGDREIGDLDEAARASTSRNERNGRVIISDNKELSEASIYAIWEAAQWPTDYVDPLGEKFSEDERSNLILFYPGLAQFLEHKKNWRSVGGQLRRRDTNLAQAER
jgi:hypothetical protein